VAGITVIAGGADADYSSSRFICAAGSSSTRLGGVSFFQFIAIAAHPRIASALTLTIGAMRRLLYAERNRSGRHTFTIVGQIVGVEIMKSSCGAIAISFVVVVTAFPTSVLAADGRCQQLEALHAQYAGVTLTPEQQTMKRQMTTWYRGHCGARHAARED